MKKIAVASEGKNVSGHFGHCEGFTIYETEGSKVLNSTFVENPGHKPGFLPVFLSDKGVDVIIAGGMGGTAQNLFAQNNIEVVVGCTGSCEDAVNKYVNGQLVSTGSVCEKHEHEGHCNE